MKHFILFILLFASFPVFSQTAVKQQKIPRIQSGLSLVIQEYFMDFVHSIGDTLFSSGRTQVFDSKITIPGAESAVITKYYSPLSYSWEAVMSESDDFDEAAKAYDQLFRQINNARVATNGIEKQRLIGKYDPPKETKSFAASAFRLESPGTDNKDFMIELDLQYTAPLWRSKISMFHKIPDDEIRPTRPIRTINVR